MEFNKHFTEFPVLHTERLLIRPFNLSDISSYLDFFTDPDVQQYLGNLSIPKDIDNATRWVNNMNGRCFKNKLVITWCIELKSSKKVIGRIDLGGFVRKSMADIAYYLSKDFWNQGIMSEAVEAVLDYGFNVLNLHRIQATVLPENEYSIKLLTKHGFVEEGLLRQYDYGNTFRDVLMYSILDNEYQE
jgi:[ribosomal protein S5]-alanine N-acetyltransferase